MIVPLFFGQLVVPWWSRRFGRVGVDVRDVCLVHLFISALSCPVLAICNAGAALFCGAGKTSVTMVVSIVSNMVNVVGNRIVGDRRGRHRVGHVRRLACACGGLGVTLVQWRLEEQARAVATMSSELADGRRGLS